MSYRASIGPIQFELTRSGTVPLPPVRGRPFASYGGTALLAVDEVEAVYLLLDYRMSHAGHLPNYVEFWRPLQTCEGSLAGLLVVSNAPGQPLPANRLPSLQRVVQALRPVSMEPGATAGHIGWHSPPLLQQARRQRASAEPSA